jgi:hypothetical protein
MEQLLRSISQAQQPVAAGAGVRNNGPTPLQGEDAAQLQQQAATLWSMLDDMAEHDPQQYQLFMRRQLEGAAAAAAHPHAAAHTLTRGGTAAQHMQPTAVVVAGTVQGSESAVVVYVWAAPGAIK